MIVAIDGPAGAGKSVVSARLAAELELRLLDTGAIYRALTLLADREGVSIADGPALADLAARMRLEIQLPTVDDSRQYTITASGEDITRLIFSPAVDARVSQVAAHAQVRHALLPVQRDLAGDRAVVVGRDIGTIVFPNASIKIYLSASPQERARRRREQLSERGERVDYDKVLAEIIRRDSLDGGREHAPMKIAPDAIVVNTDGLSVDTVVKRIMDICAATAGIEV